MEDDDARSAMRKNFDQFLQMATSADIGFILDTNTWRGCTKWAPKLDETEQEMIELSKDAEEFVKEIRNAWRSKNTPVILNGVIGPSGDGYQPEILNSVAAARDLHRLQIGALVESGVDLISAITMTNIDEATGVTLEADSFGVSVVISFNLETDGRIPSGETLEEAINLVDAATNDLPLYYMINCAHPDHFSHIITEGSDWLGRLGGIRAHASRLSHSELDSAESLDEGDPDEFGALRVELNQLLPNLKVVGGCCGTDHRHVGCVSRHLHARKVA